MILSTIRMKIAPQKHGEALKILKSRREKCMEYPGFQSSNLYEDIQENNVVVLEEIWSTQEDLDIHMRSDEYRNLLLVLEMAVKEPEIRFDSISSSAGLEIIENARGVTR